MQATSLLNSFVFTCFTAASPSRQRLSSAEETLQKSVCQCSNDTTQKIAVDGMMLPEVDVDISEAVRLMPISSNATKTRKLFSWFHRSSYPAAEDEIAIWCSTLFN